LSSADDYNPKFTGQMRDQETALDWFNARHMSGAQGRFQSVDPGNAGADPSDPQSWNMYSYVGNNPLSYTDPSGMNWFTDTFNWAWGAFKEGLTVFANILTAGHFGGLWGSSIDLGSLTHCGGPLGNCGGVGGGSWSENPGLGGVQDPDRFVFSERPADQGVVDYNVENFIAGLTDSFSFGWTRNTRTKRGLQQADYCSSAYQAGEWAPVMVGGLRLAYAGAAKSLPLVMRAGSGTLEGAYDMSEVRNSLKILFRGGLFKNFKIYSRADINAKYGNAAAKIASKATQTNPLVNAVGGGALAGGAVNTSSACRP
jgi:RHS repeat-associated protein